MLNPFEVDHSFPCFCTSNEDVIKAILNFVKKKNLPLIIESTSSQVNQYGGYSNKTPKKFIKNINKLIFKMKLSKDKIMIGGDHLGQFPWKNKNALIANKNAYELVEQCIRYGYKKIHIDTTHRLKNDYNFNHEKILKRTKLLMKLLKNKNEIVPIFGSEVPYPGSLNKISIKNQSIDSLKKEIKFYKQNLSKLNLKTRLVCVVEAGMYFNDKEIIKPNISYLRKLKHFAKENSIFYEAHSCDYQNLKTLKNLTNNGFKFLKVGPEITHNYSKSIFEMEVIEKKNFFNRSRIKENIISEMNKNKKHWINYYKSNKKSLSNLLTNSKLDRIRYYWDSKHIKKSLKILKININKLDKKFIVKFFKISKNCEKKYQNLDNYELIITHKLTKSFNKFYKSSGIIKD